MRWTRRPVWRRRPPVHALSSTACCALSVVGQIGAPTVDAVLATIATVVSGATAVWVGENLAKPISAMSFSSAGLSARKLQAQCVPLRGVGLLLHAECARDCAAGRHDGARGCPRHVLLRCRGGQQCATGRHSQRLDGGDVPGDLAANVAQTLAAISGGAATSPVVVVSQANSVRFAAFLRDLSTVGNKVLTTPAVGAKIVALDADGIAITNGAVALAVGSPDLEMSDSPTSTPSASTIMTSTWQRNLKSVRAEHLVGWARRADAAAFLTLV